MPVNLVPELRTPRLVLRAFVQSDLDAYAAICADPEVMRHIGAGGPQPRDAAWRQMALFLGQWALRGHGQWAVCLRHAHGDGQGDSHDDGAAGPLIGRVGTLQPEGWPACELAWLLARSAWGQGYAFEAVSAARQHVQTVRRLTPLESYILPGNLASARLAQRLGATLQGEVELMGLKATRWVHPPPAAPGA